MIHSWTFMDIRVKKYPKQSRNKGVINPLFLLSVDFITYFLFQHIMTI